MMERKTRIFDRLKGLRLRFFWQLVIAFVAIVLLAGGGLFLAGRLAFHDVEIFARDNPPYVAGPWLERLAVYYQAHGGWDGVDVMIADYPCGPDWGPWDESWQGDYVVAGVDGTILASSDGEWVGRSLHPPEQAVAFPIEVDGERVGFLQLYPVGGFRQNLRAVLGMNWQRFLLVGLAIVGVALVAGWGLSRAMSQPLVRLTEATRAVAAGDLGVRVPTRYPGEMGDLATAFNYMAEELARAETLRRNMTADVAHELRTPLSVVRGKLEGVLDGVYPATPEHLEPILDETKLLAHLVEDLQLLAMAEAGQLALEKRPVDMADLLRDAQVNFSPQADDRGVTLALDLPAGLPPVMGDWRRISQVLGNLLTNALRHTPQGGCVTLAAAAAEGVVEISVADTGAGIPSEDLPYVFERFWRGERSRSRAGGGAGLGLAIAKQLVELHGREICVDSTPGEGTRFWFTLPAV